MPIRTYYWHDNLLSRSEYDVALKEKPHQSRFFIYGNVGDTFTRDLISFFYGKESVNTRKEGSRLLLVGSIAHLVSSGDVLCGVGIKNHNSVPTPKHFAKPPFVRALRGQLTYDEFRRRGYNMQNCSHLGDPGLLVRYMFNYHNVVPQPHRVGFIPHYRERWMFHKGDLKDIFLINVDCDYLSFAQQILSCSLVLSSSLHGIIFSHALERPVIPVLPRTEEPLIKFKDYYSGIGQSMPKVLRGIEDFSPLTSPTSPISLRYGIDDFGLPNIDELLKRKIFVHESP
jgi:pyruvyltransferase